MRAGIVDSTSSREEVFENFPRVLQAWKTRAAHNSVELDDWINEFQIIC